MPVKDLSSIHELITNLFRWPQSKSDWDQYRLTREQIDSFHENGFLAGVKMLDDQQVEFLKNEISELGDVNHEGHKLFYEYHSNESTDPSTILFHALGAWRITPGLHDVLWNPRFVMAASQLL